MFSGLSLWSVSGDHLITIPLPNNLIFELERTTRICEKFSCLNANICSFGEELEIFTIEMANPTSNQIFFFFVGFFWDSLLIADKLFSAKNFDCVDKKVVDHLFFLLM